MKKTKMEVFKAGKIFNPIKGIIGPKKRKHSFINVSVPARLNTMCFDLKSLTKPSRKFVYNAGELAFSAEASTYAKVYVDKTKKDSGVTVLDDTRRKSIVKHAGKMMIKALGIEDHLCIESNNLFDYPHSGLGSSSSLITAVCIAINELYGNPLSARQLTLFISQNHGEEMSDDVNNLIHVQCNGGSPSVALYNGGMQIIVGESNVILRNEIPDDYKFVFGIPNFYKKRDAKELMDIETDQFEKMMESRDNYSKEISWKVLHELIPSLLNSEMSTIGDIIKYYRFETGSLKIDSITWNGLYDMVKKLIKHKDKNTPIISVSSCGPAIYALTRKPKKVSKIFSKNGMTTFTTNVNNTGYKILEVL